MKINDIVTESWSPDKEYPDTEQGAIECFTDISEYKPNEVTKVYPDPYTSYVWAIHTNTKRYGPQKHVVWINEKDFATDDRSGEEDFRVNESTTSGSIATVAAPMTTQSRNASIYGGKKGGNLLTGKKTNKKYANSKVNESKMKELATDIRHMDNGNFKKKYGNTKEHFKATLGDPDAKKTVHEADLQEDDLILVPGQGHRLKSGFIPHEQDRRDHEVEMARSDLFQAAKNAKQIYEIIENVSEDEGLEGWVQEKIIKANDYLNTVREYLEHKQVQEMTGGVIAGGGVGEGIGDKIKGAVRRMKDKEHPLQTRRDVAMTKGGAAYNKGETRKGDQYMAYAEKDRKKAGDPSTNPAGTYRTKTSDYTNEAQSMGTALKNTLAKAEPGSKLDNSIKAHNRDIKNGGKGTLKNAPTGYHFDKKGYCRLGDK